MPTKPLDRLLFAQGRQCFFCKVDLPLADASVEHLVASANGGQNGDDNCVVCCVSLNRLLGSMSLKEKIQVVLNQKGQFRCPNGARKSRVVSKAASAKAPDKMDLVIADLARRGSARPKTVKTLMSTVRALFRGEINEEELASILQRLEAKGIVTIEGTKVVYAIRRTDPVRSST